MRTLIEILNEAKEGIMPSQEECYYATLAFSSQAYFHHRTLMQIKESMKKPALLNVMLGLWLPENKDLAKEYKDFLNKDPKEYLTPEWDPMTPEYKKMRKIHKNILKKATGIDLDAEQGKI